MVEHVNKKDIPAKYALYGFIIILLVGILASYFLNSLKTQEYTTKIQNSITEQKNLCKNLNFVIRGIGKGPGHGWVGVNFCVYSSEDDVAKVIVKLKDGNVIENDIELKADSCLMQQISRATINGNFREIGYNDVSYIEAVSKTCPAVRYLVTDMSEIVGDIIE